MTKVEAKRITKTLTVALDEHQIANLAGQWPELERKLEGIKDKEDEAKAEFKRQKEKVQNEIKAVRQAIEKGTKQQDVECELRLSEDEKSVLTVRLDTNAVIDMRGLSEEEKQRKLFDEAPSETVSRDNLTLFSLLESLDVEAGRKVALKEIEGWDVETYRAVEKWAALTMMAASGDQKVEVPEKPAVLSEEEPEEAAAAGEEKEGEGAEGGGEAAQVDPQAVKSTVDAENQELADALAQKGVNVPVAEIETWEDEEFNKARSWASGSAGIDEAPTFLAPYMTTGDDAAAAGGES